MIRIQESCSARTHGPAPKIWLARGSPHTHWACAGPPP